MGRLSGAVLKGQAAHGRAPLLGYSLTFALGLLLGLAVNISRPQHTAALHTVVTGTKSAAAAAHAADDQTAPGIAAAARPIPGKDGVLDATNAVPLQHAWRANGGGEAASDEGPAATAAAATNGTYVSLDSMQQLHRLHSLREEVIGVQQLNAGNSYQGNLARPRRFMHKLMAGEPLHFAVTGGSVSAGLGDANYQEVAYRRLTSERAWPNQGHTNHMGAVSGIMSSYMNACLLWHVPQDADLVVVEFNLNDGVPDDPPIDPAWGGLNHPRRRPFERLLRKLLRMPSKPAIIIMQAFNYAPRLFMASGEDQMATFAQNYGIPTMSLRDTIWRKARRNDTGYKLEEIMQDDGLDMHPNARGHLMMADLLTGFLRRVGEGLILRPYSAADQALVDEDLPEPVLPGNDAMSADNCIGDHRFKDLCTEHPGFEWTDEGRNKWGYVATEPESKLVWTVDTRTLVPEGMEDPHTVVTVNHLRSYENMGEAEVTCLSGCACEPTIMDATWDLKVSQLDQHQLSVSQAEKCAMQVRVLAETKSQGHKIKVQGIVLSDVATPKGADGERPRVLETFQLGASIVPT